MARTSKVVDFTVGWKPTGAMVKAYNASITRFLSELEGVPDEQKGELHEVVWAAVMTNGRPDMAAFSRALVERFGLDGHAASIIAHYQCTMGRYVKDVAGRRDLLITESKWMWSGAPCEDMPHHEGLNGKRFRLEDGLEVDGKRIWPGSEQGCRCCEGAVIPIEGFE
jgi:hypothetical protein